MTPLTPHVQYCAINITFSKDVHRKKVCTHKNIWPLCRVGICFVHWMRWALVSARRGQRGLNWPRPLLASEMWANIAHGAVHGQWSLCTHFGNTTQWKLQHVITTATEVTGDLQKKEFGAVIGCCWQRVESDTCLSDYQLSQALKHCIEATKCSI